MRHYSIWTRQYAKRAEQIAGELSEYKRQIDLIMEKLNDAAIIHEIDEDRIGNSPAISDLGMCFVDGGEGLRELIGAGLYFIRASGLLMGTGKSTGDISNPGSMGDNLDRGSRFVRDIDMGVIDYDEHTKDRVEMLRGAMEFDVALKCAENYDLDYIFLDGSLYVDARKRPIQCREYDIYRKKFVRLLKFCHDRKIHIVGVSEDSESRLFTNYISLRYNINFPRFMTDSAVLSMLAKGRAIYRSADFTPQSRFETDDKLTPTLISSFPTVYVKPTALGNPMRVDVPDWEDDIDRVVEIIVLLSRGSKRYGYPLPLYLSHLDARIKKEHTEWITSQLIKYVLKNDYDCYSAFLKDKRKAMRPER